MHTMYIVQSRNYVHNQRQDECAIKRYATRQVLALHHKKANYNQMRNVYGISRFYVDKELKTPVQYFCMARLACYFMTAIGS